MIEILLHIILHTKKAQLHLGGGVEEHTISDQQTYLSPSKESQILCVMQGWFSHSYYFLPSAYILPIFVGTHFTSQTQKFLHFFLARYPYYFQNKEIGCRDSFTLQFCQKYHITSYFSRCLTLTLPQRKVTCEHTKGYCTLHTKKLTTKC